MGQHRAGRMVRADCLLANDRRFRHTSVVSARSCVPTRRPGRVTGPRTFATRRTARCPGRELRGHPCGIAPDTRGLLPEIPSARIRCDAPTYMDARTLTNFDELSLAEPLLRALTEEGYTTPTPIQSRAIPVALAGRDLLGIAQTGTGKTAAFALPILQRLAEMGGRPPRGGCRALILSPTRELASQIAASFKAYGRHMGLSVGIVFGGQAMGPQQRMLHAGVDVLVATPGRLLDHLSSRTTRLDHVKILVLDEADQMLDAGFLPAIRKLVAQTPKDRQTLFFSATMPAEIGKLAAEMLNNPERVAVTPVATTAEKVAQRVIHVEQGRKRLILTELLKSEGVNRTLVFTRTKHGADKVVKQLEADGINAGAIHGNKSQNNRERALAMFKSGQAPVMVATDIAARGIDVDGVTHVVQYDLPEVPETYVHRIGRTARAGASGAAVALCCIDDRDKLKAIEKLIRMTVPSEDRRDPNSREVPSPEPVRRGQRPPGRGGQSQGRGGQGQGRGGAQASNPRPAASPVALPAGDDRRRRPVVKATEAPRRDRNWREGDFRDASPDRNRG
ncbi:MAG: helicase [Rhodospirillales bacterium]|jgi:ATP-dependent RNA helicase RhlE|nr:helicase [Rhodospirillales bacterium]